MFRSPVCRSCRMTQLGTTLARGELTVVWRIGLDLVILRFCQATSWKLCSRSSQAKHQAKIHSLRCWCALGTIQEVLNSKGLVISLQIETLQLLTSVSAVSVILLLRHACVKVYTKPPKSLYPSDCNQTGTHSSLTICFTIVSWNWWLSKSNDINLFKNLIQILLEIDPFHFRFVRRIVFYCSKACGVGSILRLAGFAAKTLVALRKRI